MGVSSVGAAIVTNSFSLPESDYLVVIAIPAALTAVVTIRSAMQQR